MFDTIAPKLNGGNLSSGQPNNQGNNNAFRAVTDNNNLGQGNSTPDPNAQFSSNNHNQSRAGIHSTVTSTTTGRSAVQLQPPPPPARQFKAFAKGFSGLGADVLSDLSRPFDHRQGIASSIASKTTTMTSVNTLTERGSREHQAKYSAASFVASAGTSNRNLSTSTPEVTPTTAADTSFGGDDFFLDAEDLADLEHDLDLGQGQSKAKGKDNEHEEDISLSWSPTPPKAAKVITSSPLSPQSPLSRFSTTARTDGVTSTVSSASTSTSLSKQTITSNPYAASSFYTSTTSKTTARIQSRPTSSYRPLVTAMAGTSSTTFTASSSSSTSTATSRIQDKPSSSFRASATAAAATSGSTFPTSFPRDQPDSSNPERALVISSQETVITRPDGQDTVSSMDWQTPPNPQSRRVQDQESRGLWRSKSSPNARGSSIHPIRGKSRLPGPAGNLPRLSEEEKDQLFRSRGVPFRKDTRIPDVANTSPNSSIKKKMKSVSQGPIDSMFANSAWEDMLKAKHLPEYKPSTLGRVKGSNPLLQVTISDIETQQDPHRGKIPWLIAMIKDFTPSEIDAAVTLMDPSGEMRGTIHISVLDQYKNNEIRIGTVLVLNNVSVFSPTPVSHYLIITSRNIKDIYQPNSPMVINSQGSSQDRQSQKRRKNNDSQEVASIARDPGAQGTNAPPQMSGSAIHPSSKSGQYRATPPAWSSTPEDRSSNHSNGRASQELRGSGSSQSTSQDQSQSKSRISLLSSQEGVNRSGVLSRSTVVTQPKEIMFQSLRPTATETQAGQEDMLATPLITLGAMTPSVDAGGGGVAVGSSFKSLSSFAASPTLRKRSSQSCTIQRSNSSGSYPKSRPEAAGQSQSKTILSPVTGAAASQGSHHTEGDSFTGWPDDIQLDDNFDDLETGRLVILPAKRSAPSDLPVSSRPCPRPPPPSDTPSAPVSAPPTIIHDDGNEDDLELLLDGFDESDLYDI